MNKLVKIVMVALIVIAVLFQGINIYFSNMRAVEGLSAGDLAINLEVLQSENIELEEKVLVYSSLKNIASRAGELGFDHNREFVTLFSPVEMAINR